MPIKNFITDSLDCKSISLLFTLHVHLPQLQEGEGLLFCN